jgi:hypothetical protein
MSTATSPMSTTAFTSLWFEALATASFTMAGEPQRVTGFDADAV